MAVNKLRMNSDRSVSDLAKEIVAKWKKDVHTKTKPSGSSSHDGKKERMVTVSPSRTPPKPSGNARRILPLDLEKPIMLIGSALVKLLVTTVLASFMTRWHLGVMLVRNPTPELLLSMCTL